MREDRVRLRGLRLPEVMCGLCTLWYGGKRQWPYREVVKYFEAVVTELLPYEAALFYLTISRRRQNIRF